MKFSKKNYIFVDFQGMVKYALKINPKSTQKLLVNSSTKLKIRR